MFAVRCAFAVLLLLAWFNPAESQAQFCAYPSSSTCCSNAGSCTGYIDSSCTCHGTTQASVSPCPAGNTGTCNVTFRQALGASGGPALFVPDQNTSVSPAPVKSSCLEYTMDYYVESKLLGYGDVSTWKPTVNQYYTPIDTTYTIKGCIYQGSTSQDQANRTIATTALGSSALTMLPLYDEGGTLYRGTGLRPRVIPLSANPVPTATPCGAYDHYYWDGYAVRSVECMTPYTAGTVPSNWAVSANTGVP